MCCFTLMRDFSFWTQIRLQNGVLKFQNFAKCINVQEFPSVNFFSVLHSSFSWLLEEKSKKKNENVRLLTLYNARLNYFLEFFSIMNFSLEKIAICWRSAPFLAFCKGNGSIHFLFHIIVGSMYYARKILLKANQANFCFQKLFFGVP